MHVFPVIHSSNTQAVCLVALFLHSLREGLKSQLTAALSAESAED
jgi:hypothetical protein